MTALVVDASALGEVVLATTHAARYLPFVEDDQHTLHAPALCDVEVVSLVRGAVMRKLVSPARATQALVAYCDLDLRRHAHRPYIGAVFALRSNFSAYDGFYVALARSLKAQLLTGDRRLAKAVTRHFPEVSLPAAT